MNDIDNLYQELIIDHARAPKNFGSLAKKTHWAHGDNALCGDMIDIELVLNDGVIADIAFKGDGCAISKASASLMTEAVKHKSLATSTEIFKAFHALLVDNQEPAISLGKLVVLSGVKDFPMRVKCATLCWHTLNAALRSDYVSHDRH